MISLFACQKEDITVPPPPGVGGEVEVGSGISVDELDTYAGEIGLLLNAREIARKGYMPAKAVVNIEAPSGKFSKTVDLNEFSFMGQIKLPVDELSAGAKKELTDGVPVSVTLTDQEGKTIVSDLSLGTVSFLPGPSPQTLLPANLPETNESAEIELNSGTAYYLQKVKSDGTPLTQCMRFNPDPNYGNIITVGTNTTFAGEQPNDVFNFHPVPGASNTFYIRIEKTGELLQSALIVTLGSGGLAIHNAPRNSLSKASLGYNLSNDYKFKLQKIREGVYVLKNFEGKVVKAAAGIGLTFDHPTGEPIYWRPIAKDISWTVQPIASDIITPVLPKAKTGFSFNSTLRNCGSGDLTQEVGADFSEVRTNTFGWAESISINNSSSQSVSATIGVAFDAKFFGTGAIYDASVSTSFDWSQSVTTETSKHHSEDVTQAKTYFSKRSIVVPAKKASLVYDAYQFYENVRVDFVQRVRLSGIDEDGKALSGKQIRSLFQFTRFNGVINKVEANSVVFTLRGYTVLDKFMETQSNVEEVPARCN
ncbi:MAG: hypothetical protein R2824_05560 [Saprospiraceae bacterium]|nr:hypothetical protein [Lewinella sp.]